MTMDAGTASSPNFQKGPPMSQVEEITISADELLRSKRAVVVLMESFKAAWGKDKQPPLEMRKDVQALMGVLRKIEKL